MALINWWMRETHKYRFMCNIQLGEIGGGNQHKVFSLLSMILTLPCFSEGFFCYEEFGELRISLWFKDIVIDHILVIHVIIC
jgi:hypothetical protein